MTSRSCASAPTSASRSCTRPASWTPGSTATTPNDGVGGTGAFFLLLDEPEVYGFPPDPVVTTKDLPDMFRRAAAAAVTLLAGAAVSFLGRRR